MLDFVHANVISYCCVTNRSANHDNNAFDNLGRSMPPMPAFVYSPAAQIPHGSAIPTVRTAVLNADSG